MKENYIKVGSQIAKLCFGIVLAATATNSYAQLMPSQSIYYQNQYLYNPSLAGMDNIMNINASYRRQWVEIPGSPIIGLFTIDQKVAERVGLGLHVNDDQSGLIRQTRIMGTYAYHLPVGESQELHFGLSLGLDNSRFNQSRAIGDLSDDEIAAYNVLKPYIDGDFGVAYTASKLHLGAAVPNLKSVFFKSSDSRFDADRLLFIALASYKFTLSQGSDDFVLQPIGAFRVVKGYDNIVDVGTNFFMNRYNLYLQSIYHTNKSMGLGIGLNQEDYAVSFSYNVETGKLGNYTPGAFELGLRLRIFSRIHNN